MFYDPNLMLTAFIIW